MAHEIREGMTVRSSDGEKLGKVIRCDADQFIVEKGFFFPKDYVVRYDQATVAGDEVLLALPASSLREAGGTPLAGAPTSGLDGEGQIGAIGADAAGRTGAEHERGLEGTGSRPGHGTSEELRVPVAEEELVAEKHERQAGEVRVRKDVVTEHQQIEVPVTREEVHVERVPVEGGEAVGAEARFEEDEIRVPVHEEEVEIGKRPRVKEEIRVSKTAHREERRAGAEVRREEVEIEKDGDLAERGTTEEGGARKEPED
jgi:uncharacterized protein (TIGR02271 family)